jgi:hypothetical protein
MLFSRGANTRSRAAHFDSFASQSCTFPAVLGMPEQNVGFVRWLRNADIAKQIRRVCCLTGEIATADLEL